MFKITKSKIKTVYPAGLPMERKTLVAPGFPLPTLNMSTPILFATITPKGIEPKRYPTMITETVSRENTGKKRGG